MRPSSPNCAKTLDWEQVQTLLGVRFQQRKLLRLALTHSSYAREQHWSSLHNNERLEFLGDAVLELVISEYLYRHYPDYPEGELTQQRARLVQRESLVQVARALRLGEVLLLGVGEETSGGRDRESILACALEALFGAVYLDQGLEGARDYILRVMRPVLQNLETNPPRNYKGELQELTQGRFKRRPVYRTLEALGPEHERTFVAEVRLGWQRLGRGTGRSKKEAEQAAAAAALEKLQMI
ncbi:MAG TPA: ribonuclease III [Armatimonadetes bacterium]|nr:ribonuclease III [Armatimonadota bacterium]